MGSFVLSCCSTADMPASFFEKRDIAYACFHYYLGGKMYLDDLGKQWISRSFITGWSRGRIQRPHSKMWTNT